MNDQATIGTQSSLRAARAETRAGTDDAASDAALWAQISAAQDFSSFARAWLAIMSRSSAAIMQSAVLYGPANQGPYDPVARWARSASLNDVSRFSGGTAPIMQAIAERRQPAIDETDGTDRPKYAGIPLVVDADMHGAVLIEAALTDAASARRLMRHLQWGSAWIEAFVRRASGDRNSDIGRRATILIDTINAVISEPSYAGATRMFTARLADIFHCERVSFGRRHGLKTRLSALFQSSSFERRHVLGRAIEMAMDEAIDQHMVLVTPSSGSTYVAASQENLARENDGASILTVPVMFRDDAVGAATLERFSGEPFTQDEVHLCDALCSALGPIFIDKQQQDWPLHRIALERVLQFGRRLLGPEHLITKVVTAAVVVIATFLIFATDTFRVHAHAQIQGEVRRLLNAPFDGYIRAQYARAGQVVRQGELLAELQDNDLVLDRMRHVAQRRQYQLELDRALSKRDLAQTNIAHSQVEQKDAEIELDDQMLARTKLQAPFDSVIVSGDLSQSVGRPVSRGDVLFELAPLDRYRITLVVPETEVLAVHPGQTGQVLLTALPDRSFTFEVKNITPVAHVSDGVNGFEVLADLKESDPRLRPAMEGVAKIDAGRRSFVWIWGHEFLYWLRIKMWSLLP